MDNIGENEALLRSSNKFQRMGEGKKKSRLLKEAQQKDFEEIERIKRLEKFEKEDKFIKPQGMSDEEYTRKCIELQAEADGIPEAKKTINPLFKSPSITTTDFTKIYEHKYFKNGSTKSSPEVKRSPRGGSSPEVKRGPRGGRYTEDTTKEGRPYRRYF